MNTSGSSILSRPHQEPISTTQLAPTSSGSSTTTSQGLGQLILPKGEVIKILPSAISAKQIAPPQMPRETVPLAMPFADTIRVREESELPLDVLRVGEVDSQDSERRKPRDEKKKKEKKKSALATFFKAMLQSMLEPMPTPKDRKIAKSKQSSKSSKLRSFFTA